MNDNNIEDSAVVLDGETATELLMNGETTAELVTGDGDVVEHHDIEVINIAGPHPDYSGDGETTLEKEVPAWRRVLPGIVSIGLVMTIAAGVLNLMPESTISINGTTTSLAPSAAEITPIVAGLGLFATIFYLAIEFGPGMVIRR